MTEHPVKGSFHSSFDPESKSVANQLGGRFSSGPGCIYSAEAKERAQVLGKWARQLEVPELKHQHIGPALRTGGLQFRGVRELHVGKPVRLAEGAVLPEAAFDDLREGGIFAYWIAEHMAAAGEQYADGVTITMIGWWHGVRFEFLWLRECV
jgi:hypothetical protein